ncbi:uncharacterized protein LOC126893276 [Diabrotica virgifera virgifera]|uniref:Peptidase aspartic putative domain-containing protein n=1 Tax=Diabrotica virgifera virgifera TaxID=50390 RepID=A0ABM5L9Z1_DIAVI|nr:uncharacterized protein LOC126893276 [Diabrotica virgifera virgifera]
MEDLKKKRTPLKAKITRIENWLSQKASTEKDALQFQFRQTELKTCFLKYEEIMDQIDEIDEAGTEAEDRVTTEQKYFSILAGLQRKMDELLLGPPPLRSNSTQSTVATAKVRLPEITMQTFCGSFSEFNSFYQLFETLIVNNEELNNVQRFIYLKSFLRNEPLQLIDNIEVIDENFDIAVKTLKDRYENKSRVISLHIQKLLKAPSLVKSNSKALREFLTLAQQTLLALKNMSVPIEHWDLLLIEIFLQKLDFATHRAFEYDIGTKTLPTLSQFFKFLEKKCDIQEKLNVSDHDKKVNNRSQSKTSFFSSVDQPSHSFSDNNCTFCRSNAHKVYQCNDFKCLSLQEKFNFVKGKKLCFNCLGSKHFSQDCGSTRSCTLCGGHHHSSLHGTSENVSSSRNINRQALSRERNAQTPQNSQGASRVVAPISTQHSFNNRSQNEASTSSSRPPVDMQNFPDSQAATSLSALSVKTDVLLATALLQISTISENTSLSNEMLNLEFFPYNVNDKSFKTSFAVLDSITCRLPRATIDRSKIKVPQDLTLADPSYSVPGKIDLLLAGDIYSELLTDGFIRLGKNLPILQNTHLGYVIFGTINPQVFHRNSHLAISQSNVSLFVQSEPEENQLDKLLQQFFEIEEVPLVSKLTPDEELAEQIFSKTTLVLPSGRFQVNLPFVSENANKMLDFGRCPITTNANQEAGVMPTIVKIISKPV